MSTHDEFDVAAYAIGALDPAERRAVEAHLETCAACQAELADLTRVVAGIGLSAEPEAPPESLKARTMARATAQPRSAAAASSTDVLSTAAKPPALRADNVRSFPLPQAPAPVRPATRWAGLAAAAGVVLAVSVGLYALSLRSQVASLTDTVALLSEDALQLRHQIGELQLNNARLLNAMDVAGASDVVRVSLAPTTPTGRAKGRAYMSRTRGMVVSFEGLPTLQPGRAYQLWMIMDGRAPIGAGVFKIASNGTATVEAQLPKDPVVPAGATFTVAVTDEPDAGSAGPTTPPLAAGSGKAF